MRKKGRLVITGYVSMGICTGPVKHDVVTMTTFLILARKYGKY